MTTAIDPAAVAYDDDGTPLDAAAWVACELEEPGAVPLDFVGPRSPSDRVSEPGISSVKQ